MAMTFDELWAYRKIRQAQYGDGASGGLAPIDRMPRFMIPNTGFKPPKDVARALKAISREFEVIYDPLTRPHGYSHGFGCHLYSVKGGFNTSELVLEVSLQWDTKMPWPKGRPRAVGLWIVEWVKRHDKASLPGDRARIHRDIAQGFIDDEIARREALARSDADAEHEMATDFEDAFTRRRTQMTPLSCGFRTALPWHANSQRNR